MSSVKELQNSSVATLISSVLSITACGVIFSIYLTTFRKQLLSSFRHRLIFSLSVADFLSSLAYLVGSIEWLKNSANSEGPACTFQAVFVQIFTLSTAFWAVFISLFMALVIFLDIRKSSLNRFEKYFHLTAWGVPLILHIPPHFGSIGHYGYAGVWCWLTSDPPYARWVLFYMFIVLFMLLITVSSFMMAFYLRKSFYKPDNADQTKRHKRKSSIFAKLIIYPVAYAFIWIPSIINRSWLTAHPDQPIYALTMLQSIVLPLDGLVNLIIFHVKEQNMSFKFWKTAVDFSKDRGSDHAMSTTDATLEMVTPKRIS